VTVSPSCSEPLGEMTTLGVAASAGEIHTHDMAIVAMQATAANSPERTKVDVRIVISLPYARV
jgi:hypothetical protein